jgi:hypothetical protein
VADALELLDDLELDDELELLDDLELDDELDLLELEELLELLDEELEDEELDELGTELDEVDDDEELDGSLGPATDCPPAHPPSIPSPASALIPESSLRNSRRSSRSSVSVTLESNGCLSMRTSIQDFDAAEASRKIVIASHTGCSHRAPRFQDQVSSRRPRLVVQSELAEKGERETTSIPEM